jgi:transposase
LLEPPVRFGEREVGRRRHPYLSQVRKLLDETPEMQATTVLERLRPLGYTGGITIIRDRLRRLRTKRDPEAFLTLDFAPASALQVDWADFGYALPGCPRRVSAFVATLAYSRMLYIEFTVSQAMGSFLRCMDRALVFSAASPRPASSTT